MLFRDYVNILKKNSKQKIGDKKMCDLLFDSVINYAELECEEDRPTEIDKSSVSKMMNGSYPVHEFIRNHIYDDPVNEQLLMYFQKKVIPILVDDSSDLIYQLLQKVELDNISPSHKAEMKRMAKPETLACFLVDVFVLAITTNSKGEIDNINNVGANGGVLPSIVLRGIDNNRVTETCPIKSFSALLGDPEEIVNEIRVLLEEAKSKKAVNKVEQEKPYLLFSEKREYNYDKDDKRLIVDFCNSISYDLPEDFFELGDLTMRSVPVLGSDSAFRTLFEGSPESKEKLNALNAVAISIKKLLEMTPFLEAFSDYYYVSLAVENNGTDYDEDVRVVLKFPPKSVVTVDDFKRVDKNALRYCLKKAVDLFSIQRGPDYLSHKETLKWPNKIAFTAGMLDDSIITEDDVKELLQYCFFSDDHNEVIEASFDSINQHTIVAFPKIILIKTDSIDEIEYNIRSKKLPEVVDGKIDCK